MKQGGKFLIVGLGLMGGSCAIALTQKGFTVTAVDKNDEALHFARQNSYITEGTSGDASRLVAGADYILLALYPADILPWLRANRAHMRPGTIVTDLVGVKGCFVPEAQALLPQGVEFIPCHPMAGREKSGVQNATGALFQKANFIITPTQNNTPGGIAFAQQLGAALGARHIIELTVQEHDAMIAYVSQLTHAIAVALMNANDDARLPEATGDSFRDLTRIADINDEMWSELFLANAPALVAEIDAFTAELNEIKRCVQAADKPALQALMRKSAQRRRSFTAKESCEE